MFFFVFNVLKIRSVSTAILTPSFLLCSFRRKLMTGSLLYEIAPNYKGGLNGDKRNKTESERVK